MFLTKAFDLRIGVPIFCMENILVNKCENVNFKDKLLLICMFHAFKGTKVVYSYNLG